MNDNDTITPLDRAIAEAVAPVTYEYERIGTEIQGVEARLAELREARRKAKRVLDALSPPTPKGKPEPVKPKGRTVTLGETEEVWGYLIAHPELSSAFTVTELVREANGQIGMGKDKITAAIERLHETGTIRLNRVTQGGGREWSLTDAQ